MLLLFQSEAQCVHSAKLHLCRRHCEHHSIPSDVGVARSAPSARRLSLTRAKAQMGGVSYLGLQPHAVRMARCSRGCKGLPSGCVFDGSLADAMFGEFQGHMQGTVLIEHD